MELEMIVGPHIFIKAKSFVRINNDHYIVHTEELEIEYKRLLKGWRPTLEIIVNGILLYQIHISETEDPGVDIKRFWDDLMGWEFKHTDVLRNYKKKSVLMTIEQTLGEKNDN